MEYRIERDTMGEVKVPADKFWGAQTQRSKEFFFRREVTNNDSTRDSFKSS